MGRGQGNFNQTVLTSAEAARLLHIEPETLRRWSDRGKIVSQKTVGGHRRYSLQEVERVIQITRGQMPIENPWAWDATVIVNYNWRKKKVLVDNSLRPETSKLPADVEERLASDKASPSFVPRLQLMPSEDQDVWISIFDTRLFADKQEAEDWIAATTVKWSELMKKVKPEYGVIGISNAEELMTEGNLKEYEYFTP